MIDPRWANNPGVCNAYVAAGATREERVARLAEIPTELVPGVQAHVRTVFELRARTKPRGAGNRSGA